MITADIGVAIYQGDQPQLGSFLVANTFCFRHIRSVLTYQDLIRKFVSLNLAWGMIKGGKLAY